MKLHRQCRGEESRGAKDQLQGTAHTSNRNDDGSKSPGTRCTTPEFARATVTLKLNLIIEDFYVDQQIIHSLACIVWLIAC